MATSQTEQQQLTTLALREQFFDALWGRREGYVMIASQTEADRIARNSKAWREKGFLWPDEKAAMLRHIHTSNMADMFGSHPCFMKSPQGERTCTEADIVWADLEECHPDTVTPSAPIVIQSSGGRYQAIWKLNDDSSYRGNCLHLTILP